MDKVERARELVREAATYCGVDQPAGHLLLGPFTEESGPWQVAMHLAKAVLEPLAGGIDRERLCKLIEHHAPSFDPDTDIPSGPEVDHLADALLHFFAVEALPPARNVLGEKA